MNPERVIAQIYATSLHDCAYDTSFFYEAFCEACFRYMHSVSDIYESICCKKNHVEARYLQNPVYIKGEKEFCISNILNGDVEQTLYQDIIDIYMDYILSENQDDRKCATSSKYLYEEWSEISKIGGPKKYVVEIIDKYLSRANRYEFVGCLMQLPIYSVVIKEDRFHVQGKNGCFIYENCGLYDFERCEQLFEEDGREVYRGIKLLCQN